MMMSRLPNWWRRRKEPGGEGEALMELFLNFLMNNNSDQDLFLDSINNSIYLRKDSNMDHRFSVAAEMLPRKVLSIVGTGANALAEKLYGMTKGLFICFAQVQLSRKSDMKTTLKSILCQVSRTDNIDDSLDEAQLIQLIYKELRFKRYLVLILDMWEESEWTSIAGAFPTEYSCSSRVITTTHRNTVADTCCSGQLDLVYKLERPCREDEDMLATLAMRESASFVGGSSSTSPWEDCKLYLSTVPDDHEFERDSLVRKWVAEGLVADESVAKKYFDELVNRDVIVEHRYKNHCYRFGEEPTYHVRLPMHRVLRKMSREKGFVAFICDAAAAATTTSSDPLPRRLCVHASSARRTDSSARKPAVLVNVTSVTVRGYTKGVVILKDFDEHKLQVLDLEGCQDVNDDAVSDICRMVLLRYLSLKGTQVSVLPPDIQNLRVLETLDLRETGRLKELPNEVALLPKLANLLFSGGGVKTFLGHIDAAPSGTSMKVLGAVDPSKLLPSLAAYVKEVREVQVECLDGEDLPDEWPAASPIEKLKVAGRCVKLPVWIKKQQLSHVTILDIRVCQLDNQEDDLEALGKMASLKVLALSLVSLPSEKIVISSSSSGGGDDSKKDLLFQKLEVFALDCRVPWLAFKEKAMPALQRLYLKLYAAGGKTIKTPSGTVHLSSLREVTLHFSPHYDGTASVVHTVAVVEQELAHHTGNVAVNLFVCKQRKVPKIQRLGNTYNTIQWCMRNLLECVVMPIIHLVSWCYKQAGDAVNVIFFSYLLAIAILLLAVPRLLSYYLLPKVTNRVAHEITRRALASRVITAPFPLVFYALRGNSKWLPVIGFSILITLDALFHCPLSRAWPLAVPGYFGLVDRYVRTGNIEWYFIVYWIGMSLLYVCLP